MATVTCSRPAPISLIFSPRKDSAGKPRGMQLSAKRHRRHGPHQQHKGSSQQLMADRPVCPDAFAAPLSNKILEHAEQDANSWAEEQSTHVMLDEATPWMENLKGQAFWLFRTLGTIID